MKPVGTFVLGSSLISYQSLHPLIFWEGQDHHVRLSSSSFLITYIFISTGTEPLIHLCSHRGRDGLPMTKLALFFGSLPLRLLRDNAPSVISPSPRILLQLIWTGSLSALRHISAPPVLWTPFFHSTTSTSAASIITSSLRGQVFPDPWKNSPFPASKSSLPPTPYPVVVWLLFLPIPFKQFLSRSLMSHILSKPMGIFTSFSYVSCLPRLVLTAPSVS